MCTIQTLKDNGYTASGVISGTDPLKCIKVKDFKSFSQSQIHRYLLKIEQITDCFR